MLKKNHTKLLASLSLSSSSSFPSIFGPKTLIMQRFVGNNANNDCDGWRDKLVGKTIIKDNEETSLSSDQVCIIIIIIFYLLSFISLSMCIFFIYLCVYEITMIMKSNNVYRYTYKY